MSVATVPAVGLWVPAAPFRSYVLHLMESAGVSWRVVAERAGVSAAAVRTLLFGRDGRPKRRLDRHTAAGLLAVTPAQLRALRGLSVSAQPTRGLIGRLRDHGLTRVRVAELLGSDAESVAQWEEGLAPTCPAVVEARARAAVAALGDCCRTPPGSGGRLPRRL